MFEPDILEYARCWRGAKFFDAHEALETRWTHSRDRGLQGLIQLAAALHHLQRGNVRGAKRMLERALPKLRDAAAAPCPIDLASMATYGERVLVGLEATPAQTLIAARPHLDFAE